MYGSERLRGKRASQAGTPTAGVHMIRKVTSTELLEMAAAKREEARSRRGLARLASSTGNQREQLQQQASELEAQAAAMEAQAAGMSPAKPRARRPGRRSGGRA